MKVKIVVDADVIIHFSKGGLLALLPTIFNNYEYVILNVVYNEILGDIRRKLDNQIYYIKNIKLLEFKPSGEMGIEYAKLTSKFGKGESACMAYCKFNNDIIGSSNLKDIKEYCENSGITYLTTIDFLYYAVKKNLLSEEDAYKFIDEVKTKGSKLPIVDFSKYVCTVMV